MDRGRSTVVVILFVLLNHQLCAAAWLGDYFNGRGFLNNYEDEENLSPRELFSNYNYDHQDDDEHHGGHLYDQVASFHGPQGPDGASFHDQYHQGPDHYHHQGRFHSSPSNYDPFESNYFMPNEDRFDPSPELDIVRNVLRDIDNFHNNRAGIQQVPHQKAPHDSRSESNELPFEDINSTEPRNPPCYLLPKSSLTSNPGISARLLQEMTTPSTSTTGSDPGDMENLSNLLDIANQMYGFDLDGLLDDNSDETTEIRGGNQGYNIKGDTMPIIHRRKRSPQPRRSSSSRSRSSSSRSSSSRRSSSSGSSRSSGGSWWSRKPPSSSGSSSSSSRGSSTSRTSSTSRGSSSSSGSSSGSSTGRIATGTAVVGGAAVAGAGIGVATSGGSKPRPSAPTLESTPTSGYGSGGSSSGSPYPTSGGTASAPYPTAGSPTAGAPYPTAGSPYPTGGSSYPTAGAPYPTSGSRPTAGAPYPTAGAPYPTGGSSYPTAGAPYPTSGGRPTAGAPYPTAGAPYPTGGAHYPTASAPYPTSGVRPTAGSPYPTAGAPYPTAGAPYTPGRGYPTASAPYPSSPGYGYPNSAYPNTAARYPSSGSHYPGVSAYPGPSYPSSNFGNNRYSGLGGPTHSNYPKPKKSKSKKVKEVIKAAIAGYAVHKATKKARKGLFSPSVFSHRRSYYSGSSFGRGYGGYGGYGHGYGHGHGFGGSSLGAAAVGGKVAKKILGAYVKIQIAKYAMKFGFGAAKIYFRHKLGYDLRDEAIHKFIRRYQNRPEQRRRIQRVLGTRHNSTLPINITLGEDCARTCRDNDTRLCLFTFKVHLYQTLTRACYDCPRNITDCLRPECIFGAGERRLLTVVNRQLPGPAIEVCHDDRVLVEVQNDLPSSGVTLHWHGLTMDNDPFMDGVGGLTQCPIQPRETFTYSFKANFPGTHYWHAQDGLLRGEGLFGPLIVRKPDIYEPNKFFYDHDLTAHILTISDLPSRTSEAQFAERFFNEDTTPPTNLLINGRAGKRDGATPVLPYPRIDVEKGKRYRVRIINAASLNCPVTVVAPSTHNFTVIASDGGNIAAFYTHSLVIYNGERWDVVLTADQESGRYWLTVLGELECKGRSQHVVVSYKDHVSDPLQEEQNITAATPIVTPSEEDILGVVEDTELPTEEPITEDNSVLRANTFDADCSSPNITCLDEMRSLRFAPLPAYMAEPYVEDTIFLGFGALPLYNSHFYSLLYYGPEFMPPEKRTKTPQVNNLSLRLPAKPLLLDRYVSSRAFCSSDGVRRKHCVGDYCECLHRQQVDHGRVVELVLVNEGLKNETLPQPVHLHGHRFWVLSQVVYNASEYTNSSAEDATTSTDATPTSSASSVGEEEEDVELPESPDSDGFTRLKALTLFSKDQLKRNYFHPILKDTIMIPPGGYAIVRFHAQNNGYWLGESQVLLQAASGQGFVLQVGNRTTLPRPPRGFPTC